MAQEAMGIAAKTVNKPGNQTPVRFAALRAAAAVARALGPWDRSAPAVQAEAWALVQRNGRVRPQVAAAAAANLAGCLPKHRSLHADFRRSSNGGALARKPRPQSLRVAHTPHAMCCAQDRAAPDVRLGCLALLSAVCRAGGGVLWREGGLGAEDALRLSLALADDPSQV
jgi:hypothetical protein